MDAEITLLSTQSLAATMSWYIHYSRSLGACHFNVLEYLLVTHYTNETSVMDDEWVDRGTSRRNTAKRWTAEEDAILRELITDSGIGYPSFCVFSSN